MTTSEKKTLQLNKILFQHQNLKKDFVISTYTYEDIYQLAAGISEQFTSSSEKGKILCLATEDKGLIAASVLASAVSDSVLVVPYAYSKHVLKELQEETGFTKAIGDKTENLPAGLRIITPTPSFVPNLEIGNKAENPKGFQKPLEFGGHAALSPPYMTETIDPDKIFLKLFTGGSTGKSKIWAKTYRNLIGEAIYLSEKFNVSDKDIIMATVPPYHIYGLLFSVLLPFVSSASVMPDIYTFPKEIISAIKIAHPTILVSIPIHYKALNQSGMDKDISVKTAFSSASPLNKTESIEFYNQTGIGITEIYGSTETGGIATRCQSYNEEFFKPFDNIDWKIEDEHLCIRSDFISPAVPTPEHGNGKEDADGFFITGDRAAYHHTEHDKDRFVLMSRSDDIVKIAGKRVDLKEIQHKLMKIKGVKNILVFSVPGDTGRENEIAAILEGTITEADVRAFASENLEPYAMPRRIKIVDKIPVSATGKYNLNFIKEIKQGG